MTHILLQKQIVEAAHSKGFTLKDIAAFSWRVSKNFSLAGITTRNLEKVLEMVKAEKQRPSLSEDDLFYEMCRCRQRTIFDDTKDHKPDCPWRRYLEIETD